MPLAKIPLYDHKAYAVFTQANRNSLNKLRETIRIFLDKHELSRVAFATFTFLHPVFSTREAMRRMNSFQNYLRKVFKGYICVRDLHRDGSIHFHVLFLCEEDIARGSDLRELGRSRTDHHKKGYLSDAALAIWNKVEDAAPMYGFGRVEVVPIYSNKEAVCRYLTSQPKLRWTLMKKQDGFRQRWWSCSKNLWSVYGRFNSVASRFREVFAKFAAACGCATEECFEKLLGPRRCYYARMWDERRQLSALAVVPSKFQAAVAESQRNAGKVDLLTRILENSRAACAGLVNSERGSAATAVLPCDSRAERLVPRSCDGRETGPPTAGRWSENSDERDARNHVSGAGGAF